MKYSFLILLCLALCIQGKKIILLDEEKDSPKKGKVNGVIHFINCGRGDSFLIEQNGRFGLIDASRPYAEAEDVVESAGRGAEKSPDKSGQAVVNYLNQLKVKHLDWILATHAHSDHIGGMPQIAYHFVDENTKYLYKEYRETRENNEAFFTAAINSMKAKGAQLRDLTDKSYEFDFGEMHFKLINTNIHKKETKSGENQNSIAAIVTYKNKRIFLASDLEIEDDLRYKEEVGKVDLLKCSHHGAGSSSFEFLNITRPTYTIITNNEFPSYFYLPTAFLQQIVGGKVYYVGGVPTTTEDVENSAIRLYLSEDISDDSEDTKYYLYLENTGKNCDIGDKLDGLVTYNSYTFYFEEGKMLTGYQTLANNNKCKYYFDFDGHMVKNICLMIDKKEECFDENGCYINLY